MKLTSKPYLRIGALVVFVLLHWQTILAQQCTSCATVISSGSSANITLVNGDKLCIAPGVTYSGVITLNGGTLCNEGTLTNIIFSKGTFNNYGQFNYSGAMNINSSGDVIINTYSNSNFNITGQFNNSPSSANNVFLLNLHQGSKFSVGGNFTSTKGAVKIMNGIFDGASQSSETFFNIDGQFIFSNSTLDFINEGKAYVNINGALNLDGKSNKTITNHGTFNLNNALNISGNGQNAGTVTITNNQIMNVSGFVNLAYNNGTTNITNNSHLFVGRSVTISKNNNTLTNAMQMRVVQDIVIDQGMAVNNGTVLARDLSLRQGTYTNNNHTFLQRDLLTTMTGAVVNNNGYFGIDGLLSNNKGTIHLAQKSAIITNNYLNAGGNGLIQGPVAVPDTGSYAQLIISGSSTNNAAISGKIIVFDQSLQVNSTNTGFGFDQVGNPSNISSNVGFFAKAVGPGNPPVKNCNFGKGLYYQTISASNLVVCAGFPVTLTAELFFTYWVNVPNNPAYSQIVTLPASAYTWTPAGNFQNPNQQTQVVTPLVSTVYNVSMTYLGCVFSVGISITVITPANFVASIAGAPEILFPYPEFTTLAGSQTGGVAPYTYAWTPNVYFDNNGNLVNPAQVNPPAGINYTLTVTDAIGCKATTTVNAVPAPFAPLNKIPDGGYYKLVNNRMLFKFDGQYAATNLIYNIYDTGNNSIVRSNPGNNISSSIIVNSGDNRYSLNATTLPSGYYTLEVINEKKERLYLKFKR